LLGAAGMLVAAPRILLLGDEDAAATLQSA
jgi:hypothetical protein